MASFSCSLIISWSKQPANFQSFTELDRGGIRRSGKSKLMQAYIAYLKNNFENINIIFIDFMDLAYEEIKEYHALHSYVEEHYQEGKTNYLFVDEVQMCPKFELAINSLYSKGKYDIYVTGSSFCLLDNVLPHRRVRHGIP